MRDTGIEPVAAYGQLDAAECGHINDFSLTLRSPVTIRALSGWGRGEIAVCSCSSDSERFGQLMHRFPGHSKPAQLFLPFRAELRGFGGRQMPGATGFSGCGAALAAQFELQFGEAGHDGRDSSPCWCGRIDAFA